MKMLDVIAVEHEKLRLLQSSQGVVLDHADAVEPKNGHHTNNDVKNK